MSSSVNNGSNQPAVEPIPEEDLQLEELSDDDIDWDEITATTQDDWEAGRFAFDSADYPTDEAAGAAMRELIRSIGRKVRETTSSDPVDAAR